MAQVCGALQEERQAETGGVGRSRGLMRRARMLMHVHMCSSLALVPGPCALWSGAHARAHVLFNLYC